MVPPRPGRGHPDPCLAIVDSKMALLNFFIKIFIQNLIDSLHGCVISPVSSLELKAYL